MAWPWWAWILLVVPWAIILSMLGYVIWTFWPKPAPPLPNAFQQVLDHLKERPQSPAEVKAELLAIKKRHRR